jgi:glycosyltransferase involved in cell wall biosynthesis
MEALPCPSLLTVHGNGKPGERFPLNTVFLSRDHARRHGGEAYVYNGIDPAEYRFASAPDKDSRLLFVSKTSWSVKNLKGAVRICEQARAVLKIAGGNRPWGLRIKSAFSSRLDWVGPVSGETKAMLLAQARALLFPVTWHEPFGLVVVESMMSGTPVLASRQGSLPELVTPETGALLEVPTTPDSEQAWVDQIRRIMDPDARSLWSAEACRERAMTYFHYLKMAEGYENAYKRITSGEALNPSVPVTPQVQPIRRVQS